MFEFIRKVLFSFANSNFIRIFAEAKSSSSLVDAESDG